jgi:hypothetical protein
MGKCIHGKVRSTGNYILKMWRIIDMKRFFVLVAVIVMAALLAAGCGGEPAPPDDSDLEYSETDDGSDDETGDASDDGVGSVAMFDGTWWYREVPTDAASLDVFCFEGDSVVFYNEGGEEITRGDVTDNDDGTFIMTLDLFGDVECLFFMDGDEWAVMTTEDGDVFRQGDAMTGVASGDASQGAATGDDEPAYWDGLDFGENLSYVEEFVIAGDPGDYMNAAEAAKLTFDGASRGGYIPDYSDDTWYLMTLVDLAEIDGEECYIYRCEAAGFTASFACAYQIGVAYMQYPGGQWELLDI